VTVKTVKRVDRTRLGKVTRTPQGGVRVDAPVNKVGILEYFQEDGSVIREYNPPEVLQDAEFLDSLADAPVTNEHPPEHVNPGNFSRYAKGYSTGAATFDGTYARTRLALQDGQLISDVDAGEREEISLGYEAQVDYTPGETPTGEKYDGIRTSIRANHIAVVKAGRAGPDVRLRLDSNGDSINFDMDEIAKLKAKLDAAEAQNATLTEQVKKLTADLATANDPKRIDTAVAAAVALAEKRAKAKAAHPKIDAAKIDSAEVAYLDALLEVATVAPATREDTEELPTNDAADEQSPQARMIARNKARATAKAK
jgi:hypothetical protein